MNFIVGQSLMDCNHLCKVRRCVNPTHLEAVTPKVNTRRSRPYRHGGKAL